MSRYYRDDYTPWSFVFPIALAVMIGILAADLVRLMVVAATAKAALEMMERTVSQQTTPGHLPARPNVTVTDLEEPVRYEPNASAPRLPGLMKANRDKLDRACIGGTVSLRETNGWSQDMSAGTPQRCVATSS